MIEANSDGLAVLVNGAIGIVFVSAGVSKHLRRASFARLIAAHGVHRPNVVRAVARAVVVSEIVIGLMLLMPPTTQISEIGAWLGVMLLIGFGLLALRLQILGVPFRCNCGPLLASHASGVAVSVRNAMLASTLLVALAVTH
jgi:hypothetical protein